MCPAPNILQSHRPGLHMCGTDHIAWLLQCGQFPDQQARGYLPFPHCCPLYCWYSQCLVGRGRCTPSTSWSCRLAGHRCALLRRKFPRLSGRCQVRWSPGYPPFPRCCPPHCLCSQYPVGRLRSFPNTSWSCRRAAHMCDIYHKRSRLLSCWCPGQQAPGYPPFPRCCPPHCLCSQFPFGLGR